MHPLLLRQLRKHAPAIDPSAAPWRDLLSAVSRSYTEQEQELTFLDHTLEVTSTELTEANDRLRREGENRVTQLNRYYQQALESQQGMILCVRHSPRGFLHTLCRGRLARQLGLAPETVEGRTVEEVAAPENVAALNAAYARAWAGADTSLAYRNARTGIEVFAQLHPRYDGDIVTEVISSAVDISELKRAEQELRLAKDRAEAADRAKGEFLAVMSHEIRTPLNAVLGFAGLLRDAPLSPEHSRWAGTICASGESLLHLVDDILDFIKFEAGQVVLRPEPVALSALVAGTAEVFRPQAQKKHLAFEVRVAPGTPSCVRIDPHRLRQVLVILMGNALKFTRAGSVRLVVDAEPGPVDDGSPARRTLRFAVADTGIGIAPASLDRLFKPFSQVDSSMSRSFGGTGLGLAIAQRIVRHLGGEIRCESEPGHGSVFHFSILAETVDLAVRPGGPARPAQEIAPAFDPALRLLIAKDDAASRRRMLDFFSDRGLYPDIVDNGAAALAAANARRYDFILLDVDLPELDGYAVARAIRAQPGTGPAPRLVALVRAGTTPDREHFTAAGFDEILSKPVEFPLLERLLATHGR